MTSPLRNWLAMLCCAAAAVACGGSMVAGVGGGGTGIASSGGISGGTITGFGSIVVDGKRWDVRNASIVTEVLPSLPLVAVEPKLGQGVEIGFNESGTALTVRIEPAVIGRVTSFGSAVGPAAVIKVAGQSVRINTEPVWGPVTYFVGYAGASEIRLGDTVEVHGGLFFDTMAGQYAIQATRVEKIDTLPAGYVRVAGVVQSLSSGGFKVGGLAVKLAGATQIVPVARELDNGYRVVVWGTETFDAAPTLTAAQIRIKDAAPVAGPAAVAGLVSHFDADRKVFEVNGVVVDASAVASLPALANGDYVSVTGTYRSTGTLAATQVEMRLASLSDAQIQISGSITNFVSIDRFLVRGIRINAASATLADCGDGGLGYGRYVTVAANISGNVVTASSVQCVAEPPADATLSFRGTAGSIDTAAKTLVLTHTEAGNLNAQWLDTTLFVGVAPADLNGKWLAVEGFMRNGVFVLTKVELGTSAQVQAEVALRR